jgi:hypothetical protein
MHHRTHILFVDAHTERYRGNHHPHAIQQKVLVHFGAVLLRHASVIERGKFAKAAAFGGGRGKAVEGSANGLHVISGERVHDNAAAACCDASSNVSGDVLLLLHVVLQLRAVEGGPDVQRIVQPEYEINTEVWLQR